MIYLHDDFFYKEVNINATNESNLFESLLVEIWRKDCAYQKFVVGNIYRLPSYLSADLRSFTNEFTNFLNILRTRSKFIYICRDYNIDLLKIQTNDEFSIFYNNIVAAGFAPKITLPTRICDTTSTLIDNVYSNVIDKSHTIGILRPSYKLLIFVSAWPSRHLYFLFSQTLYKCSMYYVSFYCHGTHMYHCIFFF